MVEDPEIFDHHRSITAGEAAAMISGALDLAEVFSGTDDAPVTRAMAAKVLYRTARELEARNAGTAA